jgi:hypothetical protein
VSGGGADEPESVRHNRALTEHVAYCIFFAFSKASSIVPTM